MAFNPAKQSEALNSPVERASTLNDPQFENQQGYFAYDLTHQEFITPLFGQITPTMHIDTVPGDRMVVKDNTKLILNQINGNFLSQVNQYVDSFYVPVRSVYPMNFEKLLPNPTKGDDLPNSALPQVPLFYFFRNFYKGSNNYLNVYDPVGEGGSYNMESLHSDAMEGILTQEAASVYIPRILLLTNVISRGQLLDYLGINLDTEGVNAVLSSRLQTAIDAFWRDLFLDNDNYVQNNGANKFIRSIELDLTSNDLPLSQLTNHVYRVNSLSEWRSAISDIFESGRFPIFDFKSDLGQDVVDSLIELLTVLDELFDRYVFFVDDFDDGVISDIDNSTDPYADGGFVNIGKILAYQQIVAHYFTNDHVDNIFNSDLYMQLLRSVMYPSVPDSIMTTEPTFTYNGVRTEYDYISCGGFGVSLLNSSYMEGMANRQWVWITLMLLLRRSLRFGDYFSTARPNMLAVSDQLAIAVEGGQVSPIDVTKNLLMQRYLNAANYIGQGYLQYMSSIFGIKPSDTGCVPRFISHRKIELENRVTTNTATNQGAQTTNIVGYSDDTAFDVFIDDIGFIISLTSFDVLPVYKSGIENTYHFSDRFDYFNPMMQGIGDQPIRSSELLGQPSLFTDVFGYTMRNSEYKYKLSKAHGAFVNSLPGFMLSYPLQAYNKSLTEFDLNINPDFIRDKPIYLDPVLPQMTGYSPAEYFHFIVACTNQVHCARKIQATPAVLF